MKTPAFWSGEPGLLAWLLWPMGLVYGQLTRWRMGRTGQTVPVPVICIGNLTAGGAGKTPAALAMLTRAAARGERVFALSRGYGGRLPGPVEVDPARHSAGDTGDEPLLLARAARTIVARDRLEGARLAVSLGATLIVLDDGLQHPFLCKDATLAVVDAGSGVGNGFCVPAGPLRAPLMAQWPFVDHLLLIGAGGAGEVVAGEAGREGIATSRVVFKADASAVAMLAGKPLLAFAGIGRPEKFFETLRDCGLDVRQTRSFADHHAYSGDDIKHLLAEARRLGLQPVTTAKDFVRLPPEPARDIAVLPVTLAGVEAMIDTLLDLASARALTRLSASPDA